MNESAELYDTILDTLLYIARGDGQNMSAMVVGAYWALLVIEDEPALEPAMRSALREQFELTLGEQREHADNAEMLRRVMPYLRRAAGLPS